ncbi:MAG: ABC transporter ATP-binding protein [Acidimicrobiales bacterium]
MSSAPLTHAPAPHGPATARPEQRGPVLAGRGLHRRFGAAVALAGVDLALDEGESVAVMGPSGSGKSTLLHCLAGIETPDHGEVHLDGHRVDVLPERERTALRRRRFGFVFQSGFLLPELPAEENVALPLLLVGHPRRRAVDEARRWFAPLGISGLEGRRPGELSGGEGQRVSIARALVTRPSVVFADEPTATLDRATGRAVMVLLLQAAQTARSSVLVVTHDPEVAAQCDRTVRLRDGIVAVEGAP